MSVDGESRVRSYFGSRSSNWRAWLIPAVALVLSLVQFASITRAEVDGAISLQNEFGPCSVTDNVPGVRTVYVVHAFATNGAIASRFRLEPGDRMTMTYLSETHFVPAIGNVIDGLSACYGSCENLVLIAAVQYMGYGTSATCSQIHVVPYPGADAVEAIDCDGVPASVESLDLRVERGSCGCPDRRLYTGTPRAFTCEPVATRSATWGAIKALYK